VRGEPSWGDARVTMSLMRVFVTGASGWIGAAVVRELVGAGHEVVGLARSDASAAAVSASGAEPRRGDLDDLDSLRDGAAESDGVVHTAYKHDIFFAGDFEGAISADRRAVEALGEALVGSDRPLVIASGTAGLTPGVLGTEAAAPDPDSAVWPRIASERAARSLAARAVRSSAVRSAPSVHGDGDHGFVATLVGIARAKGVSAYIGDGANRWPAVHRLDAARLFRLALETAPAGTVLHGVADVGVPLRAIAEVIGRHLNLPVASIRREDATEHFGGLAGFVAADLPASSALTRARTGWEPMHPGLIADLDDGHYFDDRAATAA
jgi:nucleoside-diphosphate-sugar epimerase